MSGAPLIGQSPGRANLLHRLPEVFCNAGLDRRRYREGPQHFCGTRQGSQKQRITVEVAGGSQVGVVLAVVVGSD